MGLCRHRQSDMDISYIYDEDAQLVGSEFVADIIEEVLPVGENTANRQVILGCLW